MIEKLNLGIAAQRSFTQCL